MVGGEGHLEVLAHFHQEDAALGQVYCGLPDYLVEELVVQLLTDWADSPRFCLFLFQAALEQLFQLVQLFSACLHWAYVQSVEISLMLKNIRFKHFI